MKRLIGLVLGLLVLMSTVAFALPTPIKMSTGYGIRGQVVNGYWDTQIMDSSVGAYLTVWPADNTGEFTAEAWYRYKNGQVFAKVPVDLTYSYPVISENVSIRIYTASAETVGAYVIIGGGWWN